MKKYVKAMATFVQKMDEDKFIKAFESDCFECLLYPDWKTSGFSYKILNYFVLVSSVGMDYILVMHGWNQSDEDLNVTMTELLQWIYKFTVE